MAKLILITFTFTNKKGEEKKVRFPFDEKYYKDLHHPSVSKEIRDAVLLDYYREHCAELKYRRRVSSMPVDEEGREVDIPDESPSVLDRMIEEEEANNQRAVIDSILAQMSAKQREAYKKVHLEGKSNNEAALEMDIKKNTFSELLKRAEAAFEEIVNQKKF